MYPVSSVLNQTVKCALCVAKQVSVICGEALKLSIPFLTSSFLSVQCIEAV